MRLRTGRRKALTRDNRGDSDDAEVLADAEQGVDALLPTDGTGHEEQVHVTALDAAVGRHEPSVPGRSYKVNITDQNYRDLMATRRQGGLRCCDDVPVTRADGVLR
jgi:hypothetical protein